MSKMVVGKVLVTGSSGLVGRQVVHLLAEAGFAAVRFDLAEGADICDGARLASAMRGCVGVIHLAAVSRVAWGEADPALCWRVNVEGTDMVCRAALAGPAVPWLVLASSREVYGDPVAFPVTEDAAVAPVNQYGRSKAEAERIVRSAGMPCAILRLSNVYGAENDHPDRAIPSLMWHAMQGEVLRISGRDGFSDFVHVDDAARGIVMAAQQLAASAGSLPVLHLATGVGTSLWDLATQAIAVAGSASPIEILAPRAFDVKGFCGDPARAAEVLGWRARIGLAEGLARMRELLDARGRALAGVTMPQPRMRV